MRPTTHVMVSYPFTSGSMQAFYPPARSMK